MNFNPEQLNIYANKMGYASILKTKAQKFSNQPLTELKPNLRELRAGLLREAKFGRIIGTATVRNRGTNNIERVNIRNLVDIGKDSFIVVESNGKELLNTALKSTTKSININTIEKMPKGKNYSGTARIIDRLAVIISKLNEKCGNVTLRTTCTDNLGGYSTTEPLHWARGYKRQTPPENQSEYDKLMKTAISNYKNARVAGKSIADAKKEMGIPPLKSVKMELSAQKVEEYSKGTPLLELF